MRSPSPMRSSRWTMRLCGRREELALRLAVSPGDAERARHAAERLFGLRLDTDTQVLLAGQMHQLGLHELADAVLGRARRRAGNKSALLVGADAPVPAARQERRGGSSRHANFALELARGQTPIARAAAELDAARYRRDRRPGRFRPSD